MLAAASLPALDPPAARPATRPVVFVRNQPEASLRVRRVTWLGPLNTCDIELDTSGPTPLINDLFGQSTFIALPRQLVDGQTRWQVLAAGRLEQPRQTETATRHDHRLTLLDRWSEELRQSPAVPADDLLTNPNVGQALSWLSDAHHADLNFDTLPRCLKEAPLLRPLRVGASLGEALPAILEDHGLFIQRDFVRAPSVIQERRSVRALEHGRRIRLALSSSGSATTRPVTQIESETQTTRARLWIARGEAPRVESTFTLIHGWDAALEGQPDDDYDVSLSSDFSRFANVYRRWVLNEDAAVDGPAFDLAAFFDQPALTPVALPFGDCLTLDDAGRPLARVVELSTDAGITWSRTTEPTQFMPDRAGLTLTSPSLPAALLSAAKTGDLRVRVTASLTSPQPIEARRWQGNPFADVGPEVVLDASQSFTAKRITPGSLHAAAVAAGQLTANLRDDTDELAVWLLEQLDRDAQTAVEPRAQARLTLTHARPEIRIGDRLDAVQVNDRDLIEQPTALPHLTASVSQVRCDFVETFQTVLTVTA